MWLLCFIRAVDESDAMSWIHGNHRMSCMLCVRVYAHAYNEGRLCFVFLNM